MTDTGSRKDPLVIIAGPTAIGKSEIALKLAKMIGGEIISADSMQVYKRMDIGTAKLLPEDQNGVPHHLIDLLEPSEPFHVVRFQEMALQAADEILSRGHIPILTGGTGFYIGSVLYRTDFTQAQEDPAYRSELEEYARVHGSEKLHERLAETDPEAALAIPAGNVRRVVRAMEFYHLTGIRISEHNRRERERESAWNAAYFVLTDKRERIYERINLRVQKMLDLGLEDEVRRLKDEGCTRDLVSMKGIGYKEMLDYLDGFCTLEEAADKIRQETRHFAKRQLTWFRREKEAYWISREDYPEDDRILEIMLHVLNERNITGKR